MAAVAVAWVLAQPGVTAAIVGARGPAQVDGWLEAGDLVLDQEDLRELEPPGRSCTGRRRAGAGERALPAGLHGGPVSHGTRDYLSWISEEASGVAETERPEAGEPR